MALGRKGSNLAVPTSGAQQVSGMFYPVAKAEHLKGAKPTSAPKSLSLKISNKNEDTQVVPLFNWYHQNEKANQAILDYYRELNPVTGTDPVKTLSEAISLYDPENPIKDVTVKAVNGKPLKGIYRELAIMPSLVVATKITTDNTTQFDEEITIEYNDWNNESQTYVKELTDYSNVFAQDNTKIQTDISFYIDGRLTVFLPIPGKTTVTVRLATEYHFNRVIFK